MPAAANAPLAAPFVVLVRGDEAALPQLLLLPVRPHMPRVVRCLNRVIGCARCSLTPRGELFFGDPGVWVLIGVLALLLAVCAVTISAAAAAQREHARLNDLLVHRNRELADALAIVSRGLMRMTVYSNNTRQ